MNICAFKSASSQSQKPLAASKMTEQQYIESVIDMHLDWYAEIGRISDKFFVHKDMYDKEHEEFIDSVYWKPIKSKLTETDFIFVQDKINLDFPIEFKEILKYKHFMNLSLAQVEMFDNKPTWKDDYLKTVKEYEIEYSKIKIIPIGTYSDYGLTAIELESKNIIWLDSQYDYEMKHKEKIAENLFDFIKQSEESLNNWKNNIRKI